MDDLKKLSVERLRELARKHLGKGHSRLRTKAQLVAALKDVLREPLSRLLDAAESVLPGGKKVRVVEFPPGRRGRVRAPGAKEPAAPTAPASAPATAESAWPGPPPAPAAKPIAPVGASRAVPRGSSAGPTPSRNGRARRESRPPSGNAMTAAARVALPAPGPETAASPAAARTPEPPVEEAFFEAPAVPRRPRRPPAPAPPPEPEPFASPREVGTEAPLLLVRDPTTLFLFWDFRRELERGAALGLREPRLLLHLCRGEDLDRSLELPLTARSVYVTGLASGQEYTAEVLLLGRDGWTRPVGARSAARRLPPGRVSSRLEVRTLRLPWSEPLSTAPAPAPAASTPSGGRHEPLDSPRRLPLPTSPGAQPPSGGGPAPSGGPRSGRN